MCTYRSKLKLESINHDLKISFIGVSKVNEMQFIKRAKKKEKLNANNLELNIFFMLIELARCGSSLNNKHFRYINTLAQ